MYINILLFADEQALIENSKDHLQKSTYIFNNITQLHDKFMNFFRTSI